MEKRRKKNSSPDVEQTEILKDLLITQLGLAGLPQLSIRAIVGCDIHRVSRILRHLKTKIKK